MLRTKCLWGTVFQGIDDAVVGRSVWGGCGSAVRWAVLMGGGRPGPCVRQRAGRPWHLKGVTAIECNGLCCLGMGGCATEDKLVGRGVSGGRGGASGGVVGGWAAVRQTTRSWAAAFRGMWCIGWCCWGEAAVLRTRHVGGIGGEKVVKRTTRGSLVIAFRENVAVQRAVLSGERWRCDGQWGGMQRCVCILFAHGHRRDPWREERARTAGYGLGFPTFYGRGENLVTLKGCACKLY
jgi:hypothetical protein